MFSWESLFFTKTMLSFEIALDEEVQLNVYCETVVEKKVPHFDQRQKATLEQ